MKVALITGASSGIGHHLATVFASNGYHVALASRRTTPLQQLASQLTSQGYGASSYVLDLSCSDSIVSCVDTVVSELSRVDVLINNAGMAMDGPALTTTSLDFETIMKINCIAPFELSTLVVQQMILQETHTSKDITAHEKSSKKNITGVRGTIINIGSIAGLGHARGLSAYGASKAALHHWTKSVAAEWATLGIRVNAIAPGYIETDLNASFMASPAAKKILKRIPLQRCGEMEELNAVALMLADHKATSFLTGAVIPVDGGHSCS